MKIHRDQIIDTFQKFRVTIDVESINDRNELVGLLKAQRHLSLTHTQVAMVKELLSFIEPL